MKEKGILIFATENAKKNYKEKRKNKSYCYSCKIKIKNKLNNKGVL